MNLFQLGDFTLNSGKKSQFKIDCDALTDEDLRTIAFLIAERLPLFGKVEGVPTGGLRLAEFMQVYCNPERSNRLLIVDDVCTTGGSMERHRAGRLAIGAVIFARNVCPDWVMTLFEMQDVDL